MPKQKFMNKGSHFFFFSYIKLVDTLFVNVKSLFIYITYLKKKLLSTYFFFQSSIFKMNLSYLTMRKVKINYIVRQFCNFMEKKCQYKYYLKYNMFIYTKTNLVIYFYTWQILIQNLKKYQHSSNHLTFHCVNILLF